MSLKLCFDNEIHRVSKLPVSISALIQSINTVFDGRLPESYTLQYFDCDGDKIMLVSEEDYKSMIQEHGSSSKAIKIYINNIDSSVVQKPDESSTTIMTESQVPAEAENNNNYSVIEKDQPVLENEKSENEPIAQIESTPVEEEPQEKKGKPKKEKSPKTVSFGDVKHKVKKLVKKLNKKGYSEEDKKRFQEKLDTIRSKLSPEQQVKFDKKKAKTEQKVQNRKKHMKGMFMNMFKESVPGLFNFA